MHRLHPWTLLALSVWISPLIAAAPAFATGGRVVLRTDNGAGGYYYGLTGSGQDRFISEYLDGTYSQGAVICGARVRELNLGTLPAPGYMGGDLRVEDALNPGYPNLADAGLVATVDASGLGTCSMTSAVPRFFTFGAGAGVLDPEANHYISAIEPVHGTTSTLDFCGIILDTNSKPQGWSKTYTNGGFGAIPWNHFVELVVFEPKSIELGIRAHGSARVPGDTGIPVVFTTRPNTGGSVTDDNISLSLSIDNRVGFPIQRNIVICADRSVISPAKGLAPITGHFRAIGGGAGITNPTTLPVGRTILRLEVARESVKTKAANLIDRKVVNLPVQVLADDPTVDISACGLDGFIHVDVGYQSLGLRRRAGSPDDNTAEAFFVVQSPNKIGDSLNVRHRAIDLPRTVSISITGIEVVGGEIGMSGLPGLDAIELRTQDPVFTASPDLSGAGLLRSFGTADGVGEAPLPALGAAAVFDVADVRVDPAGLRGDLYARGLFLPGETSPVTAIAADQIPGDTLLGDSSFTVSGVQPAIYDPTSNFMLRLLLDGDRSTLASPSPPATVSPHAFLRRVGEFIAIDHKTGRRRDESR